MLRVLVRPSAFLFPVAFALVILFRAPAPAADYDKEKAIGEAVTAAESVFLAMQARDYPGLWKVLSAASQDTILEEAGQAIVRGGGAKVSKESLRRDFESGGPASDGYWYGFLTHFDPKVPLERSKWEVGNLSGDRAEILLTHKGSEKPALLKLYREEGRWKVGLVETFWGRK